VTLKGFKIGSQKESKMSKGTRRKFSAEQKAAILRRHLVEKTTVSDLCEKYELQPSQFYLWQKQAMDSLAVALEPNPNRRESNAKEKKLSKENEALKSKLSRKDNIIAEISEEFVKLKKELGEL
jgi:transposase-like protein